MVQTPTYVHVRSKIHSLSNHLIGHFCFLIDGIHMMINIRVLGQEYQPCTFKLTFTPFYKYGTQTVLHYGLRSHCATLHH